MKTTMRCHARRVRSFAVALAMPLAACDEDPIRVQVVQQRGVQAGVVANILAPAIVQTGTQVGIGLQLRNPGVTPVTVTLLGFGQQYAFDVQVFAADGTLVWQHLPPGQPPPTTTTQLTLAPGGSITLPAVWDARVGAAGVPAGTYTVHARALSPVRDIVAAPRSIAVAP